jgi:hypothetical protein
MKKIFAYICILSLIFSTLPSFSQAETAPIVTKPSLNISETTSETKNSEKEQSEVTPIKAQNEAGADKNQDIKTNEKDIKTFKVDGNLVEFETQPILLNQSIMVPMKEFFQALGCDVKWISKTKEVIAYKNNMFIKLKINNSTAYKNGKAQTLKEAPIIRDNKTLVPANFIAETFDMKIEYDQEKSTVEINSTENTNKYTILSNSFYKEQLINDFGVSISTPTFWNKEKGLNNTFGYEDDFELYQLVVNKQNIDKTMSLNRFTERHKAKLLDVYGEALSFNGKSTLKTDNFEMNTVFLSTNIDEEPRNQILYFVTANGTGYIITCTYGRFVNEEDAIDLFNNILGTFQVNNLTLNSEEEHYFEFSRYYDYNLALETEIYSNMSVDNSFVIKGSLDPNHNISELKAIVSKEKEQLEFPIAIEGNTFNGTIYLPFGLGKHNVVLAGVDATANIPEVGEPITVYVNDTIVKPSVTEDESTETGEETTDSESLSAEEELEEIKALTEKLNKQNEAEKANDITTAEMTTQTETVTNTTDNATDDNKVSTQSVAKDTEDTKDEKSDIKATTPIEEKALKYDPIEDYYLMKFSVVNLSNEKIRYKIPSRLINSDSMDLYNSANYITYKSTSDYTKSRTLFQWISENIVIVKPEDASLHARSSLEILNSKTATQEEIPILYCALLRSLNIPSRVMVGHYDGEVSYWTEILLNGTWIVSNPTWEILYKDELTKNNAYTNYFNIYRPTHYGTFEKIDLLPY